MNLVYLRVNQAWAFLFGNSLIRMFDCVLFETREFAVDAAKHCGLIVNKDGSVSVEKDGRR